MGFLSFIYSFIIFIHECIDLYWLSGIFGVTWLLSLSCIQVVRYCCFLGDVIEWWNWYVSVVVSWCTSVDISINIFSLIPLLIFYDIRSKMYDLLQVIITKAAFPRKCSWNLWISTSRGYVHIYLNNET